MKQSSTRQDATTDDHAALQARAPAQTMADQRPATAVQRQQVAAMQNSATTVARQQLAGSMAAHTGNSLAQGGSGALQLKAAEGQGVAQLGLLDWLKEKFGMGQDAARRATAKKAKIKNQVKNAAMGMVHGGGYSSRYEELDPKSEQDYYDDELDKESAARARREAHPVLEPARMLAKGVAGAAISAGGDALNALAPGAGTVAGKVAGAGVDYADEQAKGHLEQGLPIYKVLRDEDR